MEAQSVVVIQDASRDASLSAIRWALHGLSLKSGDKLTLLAVLHQVNNPMGFKSRGDSNSMLGPNQRILDIESARRKETYHNNVELIQMSKLYEVLKIGFKVEVATGPTPKVVALRAAESLKPTWVILDRQMKKDRKYFLEKLSCGISRIKLNNNIELLRGPKRIEVAKLPTENSHNCEMAYDEMMPGSPEGEDLFSIELFPTSKIEADQVSQDKAVSPRSSTTELVEGKDAQEMFEYLRCTICNNRRPKVGWKMDFKYSELEAATDGFSPKNSLSDCGFGPVYRGWLKCKLNIAVQQLRNPCLLGETQFKSEVQKLGNITHKNVIILLGSCTEGSHRLLVYEYACNGSLNRHLSKYSSTPLTWTDRTKIALGAARGLHYLHKNNIIHRDIRPSNILLTHDLEPLLGGFGLARMQYESDQSSNCKAAGTYGYVAPEYAEKVNLSTKTDVYSFGVVLLELITGRNAADTLGEQSLAGWARPLLKERKYIELIDPRIADSHDADQLFWMVQVAEKCTSKNPKKRLAIDKVVSALEYVTKWKSCFVIENFCPTKSYKSKLEQERSTKEVKFNGITSIMNRSFSLPSPANFSTISSSSSLGKSSSSSTNSYRMIRAKSRRPQLSYGEMLN